LNRVSAGGSDSKMSVDIVERRMAEMQ